MALLTAVQAKLLAAFETALADENNARAKLLSARAELSDLLEQMQRVGLPSHCAAHALLRLGAHAQSVGNVRRAMTALRKRRERMRRSNEEPG